MAIATAGLDHPFSVAVAEAAAEWFVQLSSENVTPDQLEDWLRWRESDPEHERAWLRTQSLMQKFGGLDSGAGMAALDRPRSPARRRAVKHLVLMLTVGGALAAASRTQVWETTTADYRTAVGEQRRLTLDDGTSLVLDTDSAVDVRFDTAQRLLVLHSGAVMVETGHRAEDAERPFRVMTQQGVATALGTRFSVRADNAVSQVEVFEGAVELHLSRYPDTRLTLRAGQGVEFDGGSIAAAQALPAGREGWAQGVLFADAMRLQDFLAELSRYRRGRIDCAPEAVELRITGSFPLRDTDAVLQAVTGALPVRMETYTRFWVRMVPT